MHKVSNLWFAGGLIATLGWVSFHALNTLLVLLPLFPQTGAIAFLPWYKTIPFTPENSEV